MLELILTLLFFLPLLAMTAEVRQRYFSVAEAAQIMGVSHMTAERLIYSGKIKSWKIGGSRKTTLAAIEEHAGEPSLPKKAKANVDRQLRKACS